MHSYIWHFQVQHRSLWKCETHWFKPESQFYIDSISTWKCHICRLIDTIFMIFQILSTNTQKIQTISAVLHPIWFLCNTMEKPLLTFDLIESSTTPTDTLQITESAVVFNWTVSGFPLHGSPKIPFIFQVIFMQRMTIFQIQFIYCITFYRLDKSIVKKNLLKNILKYEKIKPHFLLFIF